VPVDSHELGKMDHHDSEEDLVGRWFQKEWLPMQTQENTETLVKRMVKSKKHIKEWVYNFICPNINKHFKCFPVSKQTKPRSRFCL